MNYEADETRCDACGQPTPRLDPSDEIELCDACFRAEQQAIDTSSVPDGQTEDWLVNGNGPRRI